MEAEFIGTTDSQCAPLPIDGFNLDTWAERAFLSSGSLIAKSCKAAMELAGHTDKFQNMAFQFGKHLALAWTGSTPRHFFIFFHLFLGCFRFY